MKCVIDFAVLLIIYRAIFYKKWEKEGIRLLIFKTLMYVYISLVLFVTLMPIVVSIPFIFDHPYVPMNMEPFIDYIYGRGNAVRQIGLNVIMMIPFGFLLPIIRKTNILKCILWTFLFSLSIELLQPLSNGVRSADITDLITNVTGGISGYILYLVFNPIIKKITTYLDNLKD